MKASGDLDCPCGRGRAYAACCEPAHRGAEPERPEDLVAARYAAFVRGDAVFLQRTLPSQHDDHAAGVLGMKRVLRSQGKSVRYRGLTLLDRRGPDASGAAQVLFLAQVWAAGRDVSFVERSYFLHDGVGWRYLVGETRAARALGAALEGLDLATFERHPA